jgi:hypothetical protein
LKKLFHLLKLSVLATRWTKNLDKNILYIDGFRHITKTKHNFFLTAEQVLKVGNRRSIKQGLYTAYSSAGSGRRRYPHGLVAATLFSGSEGPSSILARDTSYLGVRYTASSFYTLPLLNKRNQGLLSCCSNFSPLWKPCLGLPLGAI